VAAGARLIELNHVIEHGMVTYRGLPAPLICDFWTREGSAAHYDDGASFQIGRIDMVANTGTYVDAPFHRFADGADLAALALASLADLPGLVVRWPEGGGRAVPAALFDGLDVRGRAVLIHTGWDRHWRTDTYFEDHPYLAADAAARLAAGGAALVGIDSYNIDDTHQPRRPVHTALLGAGIPICEHMTGLDRLPDQGFRFHAAPPRIAGMGTFPARAYAVILGPADSE
jgi:kynurenine formamidase